MKENIPYALSASGYMHTGKILTLSLLDRAKISPLYYILLVKGQSLGGRELTYLPICSLTFFLLERPKLPPLLFYSASGVWVNTGVSNKLTMYIIYSAVP